MAKLIPIDDKLALAKEKKEALIRKRKIQAVQKIFQCTQCAFKCEKCGTQIGQELDVNQKVERPVRIPYRLCESCTEEYIDYIERHQGRGDPDCYWHNESWIELWRSWIAYHGAIDSYLKSKEFMKLLQELKQQSPDE